MLNLETWMSHWLPMIRSKLGFNDDDREVVLRLIDQGIDNSDRIKEISHISQKLIAFGAGPNLDREFADYLNFLKTNNNNGHQHQLLAADGAAHKLIENNIFPDYIFTDLDGLDLEVLVEKKIPATIFILAHGDNILKIEGLLNRNVFLKYGVIGRIIWCTQGQPVSNWINTLGFTDGDRGPCYFIDKGCEILLLGYDLHSERIGRWSKKPYSQDSQMTKRKRLKLEIASEIFDILYKSDRLFSSEPRNVPSKLMMINEFLLGTLN